MLVQWSASVVDGGPTLNQYWVNASCLLGAGKTWRPHAVSMRFTLRSLSNIEPAWNLVLLADGRAISCDIKLIYLVDAILK